MGKKMSNATINKRVHDIFKMIMLGIGRADILRYGADNWDLKERQIDNYISRARAEFAKSAIVDRDEQLGLALIRLNDLYSKSMHIDDYRASLQVQKEISALLGLEAPKQRININMDIGLVTEAIEALEILDQDPAEIFNEIIARAKASVKAEQDASD